MELILWRHADAEDALGGDDMGRALTKKGRKQAERMALWLAPRLSEDWLLLSSPARRAVETAQALGRRIEEREALGPGMTADDVLAAAGWPDHRRPVLVVGHQPTLGEVAAMLLASRRPAAVRKAAAWWFAARDGEILLRAVMDPDLAAA